MNISIAHNLIDCIETARQNSPKSTDITIAFPFLALKGFSDEGFLQALRCVSLEGALSFEVGQKLFGFRTFQIRLLPAYEVYKKNVLDQFYGKKPIVAEPKGTLPVLEKQNASRQKDSVFVRFDDLSRHILLNDCFLIAQPAYDSENYRFFEYVWKHPHRLITLQEFNQTLEEPLKKGISKILENLNFRGPLKDAFFQVSKTSVLFTPVRTIEALTNAGLFPLRLFSTQKEN